MLLVLPPTKTKLATLFLARQGRTWVLKRATLLFILVCYPGSNAINSYVYFILLSFQFSVSLFIISVRCFQSHFKVKQIASQFHVKSLLISSQSECFLTVRFSFDYAILLILLARPSYFKQCLIFQ